MHAGRLLKIAIVGGEKLLLNTSEVAVMREVQTIHQAQVQYLSQFGRYATTLGELGPGSGAAEGPRAARLIPASLASGEKNGYMKYTPTRRHSA